MEMMEILYKFKKYGSTLRNSVILLALFNIAIWTTFFVFNPFPELTSHEAWFQRSGSLTLISSAILEYLVIAWGIQIDKSNQAIAPEGGLLPWMQLDSVFQNWRGVWLVVLHINLALSTVIWGFGDMIYLSIFKG